MEENIFDEFQNVFSKLKLDKAEMEKKALENPELFLKEVGFDPKNMNIEALKKISENLSQAAGSLGSAFNNSNFKDLNSFHDTIKNKVELTDSEKNKLKELGVQAFTKDLKDKQKSCFIDTVECDNIIKAHSIQKNGELTMISSSIKNKSQVYHFIQNTQTGEKELTPIDITTASTFYGFCHEHDQAFEPIDKGTFESDSQRFFLYSLRSFAHSYHNVKSFQNYFLGFAENALSGISPMIELFQNMTSSLGLNLPNELKNIQLPTIDKKQQKNLEVVRFEKHRGFLIEFLKNKSYSQLDFLSYEINHLCPIVCASWMVMHIDIGRHFMVVLDESTPYLGYPIIISLLPVNKQKSILVLARFKVDSGSEFIFNQLSHLKLNTELFEKEISKLIIENVENFYLSPTFWNNLSHDEQALIKKATNIKKSQFPESRTEFEVINFFDKKYSLQG